LGDADRRGSAPSFYESSFEETPGAQKKPDMESERIGRKDGSQIPSTIEPVRNLLPKPGTGTPSGQKGGGDGH